MTDADYPPIAELVPHAGPMRLLERVLAHDPMRTLCEVRVDESALFAGDDGRVPVWVGLEYMAQAIAAHAGLVARAAGEPPRAGLLLGSRRLRFFGDAFARGERLRVEVQPLRASAALVAFACSLRDASGALRAEGTLNVYVSPELGPPPEAARGA